MKILLVEDHQEIAGIVFDYFELKGYELDHAANGEFGLELGLANSYDLIGRLMEARAKLADDGGAPTPLLVKIAPDLTDEQLADIAAVCVERAVDGVIISNTTLSREGLEDDNAKEQGGLSGAPLFELSTRVLADFARETERKLPLIGVGGVSSAETAYAKITAGASLVQLYTSLVYAGPELVAEIKRGLAQLLEREGFGSVSEAVGAKL